MQRKIDVILCPQRNLLLDASAIAVREYADSSKCLMESVGRLLRPEYRKLLLQTERAKSRAMEAREALTKHREEHGC